MIGLSLALLSYIRDAQALNKPLSIRAMPDSRAHPVHSLPERVTLVLKQRFEDVLEPPLRTTLERDILPAWLAERRWLGHTAALIELAARVYRN